jgi:hypothetical protein
LLLLSLERLAFQSSKDRRSSSTGPNAVRGRLRQQMGSSDGLGARAAMAWKGSYEDWVVGDRLPDVVSIVDAKNIESTRVETHDKGLVNITCKVAQ